MYLAIRNNNVDERSITSLNDGVIKLGSNEGTVIVCNDKDYDYYSALRNFGFTVNDSKTPFIVSRHMIIEDKSVSPKKKVEVTTNDILGVLTDNEDDNTHKNVLKDISIEDGLILPVEAIEEVVEVADDTVVDTSEVVEEVVEVVEEVTESVNVLQEVLSTDEEIVLIDNDKNTECLTDQALLDSMTNWEIRKLLSNLGVECNYRSHDKLIGVLLDTYAGTDNDIRTDITKLREQY